MSPEDFPRENEKESIMYGLRDWIKTAGCICEGSGWHVDMTEMMSLRHQSELVEQVLPVLRTKLERIKGRRLAYSLIEEPGERERRWARQVECLLKAEIRVNECDIDRVDAERKALAAKNLRDFYGRQGAERKSI